MQKSALDTMHAAREQLNRSLDHYHAARGFVGAEDPYVVELRQAVEAARAHVDSLETCVAHESDARSQRRIVRVVGRKGFRSLKRPTPV